MTVAPRVVAAAPYKKKKEKKKDSCVRSEGALQRPITGTCVASMIVPTVPMRFAPSWARGEGAVTSLLRMLGMAATKALNGPVALVVLTERRGRIRVCRPREVRSGHGSRGHTRKKTGAHILDHFISGLGPSRRWWPTIAIKSKGRVVRRALGDDHCDCSGSFVQVHSS